MQWAGLCSQDGCPNPSPSSGMCDECKTAALAVKPKRKQRDDAEDR